MFHPKSLGMGHANRRSEHSIFNTFALRGILGFPCICGKYWDWFSVQKLHPCRLCYTRFILSQEATAARNVAIELNVQRVRIAMEVGQKPYTSKKPSQLVYLELGLGNGGMLLSISDDGFRFRAVSPVRANLQLPFAFSLDGAQLLEGSGVVVEVEDEGKSGAIRFTEVSDNFRASLRLWLAAESSKQSGREVTPAASTPLDTMEKIRQELRAPYEPSPRASQTRPQPEEPIAQPLRHARAPVNQPPAPELRPVEAAGLSSERSQPSPSMEEAEAAESEPLRHAELAVAPQATVAPSIAQPFTPPAAPPVSQPVPKPVTPPFARPVAPEAAPNLASIEIPEPEPETPVQPELPVKPKDTAATVSKLFSTHLQREPQNQEPPTVSSAFLKPRTAQDAPSPALESDDVLKPRPAYDRWAPVAPFRAPEDPAPAAPAPENRPYIPQLETSFQDAWEHAKLTAPPQSPHLSRAAAGGIIALALAVILGALIYNFRQDIGALMVNLGHSISGDSHTPAENAAVPAASSATAANKDAPAAADSTQPVSSQPAANGSRANSTPSSTTTSPAPGPAGSKSSENEKAAPANSTPVRPPAADSAGKKQQQATKVPPPATESSAASPASSTTQPAGSAKPPDAVESVTGQDEFNVAREILRGNRRQTELPKAIDLLWVGVRKGYVPAEVTLADLFLRGDGVAKNCDQAAVLLTAASKKGSVDARRMLEKVAEQGCQ
jgi:hypothetical protein